MESSKMPPLCPMIPIHFAQSYSHFPPTHGQKETAKSRDGLTSYFRSPSESLLIDGQPSWLDELLNDTETEAETKTQKTRIQISHRRSASDTYAFVESTFKPFYLQQGPHYKNVSYDHSNHVKSKTKSTSLEEKFEKDLNLSESRSIDGHERAESSSPNTEGSIEGSTQVMPSLPKKDSKRSKQQFAHKSRVRKLQYISQLEKAVQFLQAEGTDIFAELHFVDQQNLILNMENRSLKQQLDSITQEHLIKQLEHEMLERELGRLQASYHMQMQQHQQIQKNRHAKNRELGSNRGSMNGLV